jgi:hypothetical protein
MNIIDKNPIEYLLYSVGFHNFATDVKGSVCHSKINKGEGNIQYPMTPI